MEATQTPNPITFETVWAALMEDRERLKETDRILKENFERYEREMEKSKKELNEKLGEYINLFGEVTEYELAPKMREKFNELGFNFSRTCRNFKVRDNNNDIFFEIDVMLENENIAMLVEIKTKLTNYRIADHIGRLEKMRKYADFHGDKRAFLGAIAGVILTDKEREYALEQGFYLIEPAGQDLSITPPNCKPREW